VVAGRTDADGVGAGCIDAQHATHGGDGGVGGVWGEVTTPFAQTLVEPIADDSGLDADDVVADGLDVRHMAREVDDQSRTDNGAGDAAPRASWNEGDFALLGVAGQGDDVIPMPGVRDSSRPNLVEAGIGSVHRQRQRVEPEFTLKRAGEVFADALLLFVHVERK
jgi:hypothetical protein